MNQEEKILRENIRRLIRFVKNKNQIEHEKFRGLVEQDISDGSKLGITGTPGFLVGTFNPKTGEIKGEVLSGAQPYNVFKKTLDKYLSRQQNL